MADRNVIDVGADPRKVVFNAKGERIENVRSCNPITGQCWHYMLDPVTGARIDGQFDEKEHPAPLEVSF